MVAATGTGPCHIAVWCSHGSCDSCRGGGAAWGWGFTAVTAAHLQDLVYFALSQQLGLSHLHHTGARWVQGESGCCYSHCISSLHVGAAWACWEDRSLPILPAAGAWSLAPAPAAGGCSAAARARAVPPPQRAGGAAGQQEDQGKTRQTQALERGCLY